MKEESYKSVLKAKYTSAAGYRKILFINGTPSRMKKKMKLLSMQISRVKIRMKKM